MTSSNLQDILLTPKLFPGANTAPLLKHAFDRQGNHVRIPRNGTSSTTQITRRVSGSLKPYLI